MRFDLNFSAPMRAITILLFCFANSVATATEWPDPKELVDATVVALRENVAAQQSVITTDPRRAMSLVEEIVWPHVDLPLASRLVLGSHWVEATPEQRSAFVDGLRGLLTRIFAIHISDYADADVVFEPTEFKGKNNERALVRTEVSRPGVPTVNVDYRLHLTPEGWKVYDVSIVGVSLVKTYRLTITGDVEKLGIDGIIEQMNAMSPLEETSGQAPAASSPPA